MQPLIEDNNKKHPKTHVTSTSIHPTRSNAVKEEDDLGPGRCSSMESEGLKGYVETHSIGVGIAKDEKMLLVDQTPDDRNDIMSSKARLHREELRAESEIASVHISQKLELFHGLMRDEEEQRRNNKNDVGITNQDSMRISEIFSPTASVFD